MNISPESVYLSEYTISLILNFHDCNSRRLENGHDSYLALKYLSKKKITFTKIAFEKFMKVLLHDILSS